MQQKGKRPGLPPEAGRGKTVGAAIRTPFYHDHREQARQPPHLQAQALKKARRANLLAECCRVAGDDPGFTHWRKRAARHQRIAWEAGYRP